MVVFLVEDMFDGKVDLAVMVTELSYEPCLLWYFYLLPRNFNATYL